MADVARLDDDTNDAMMRAQVALLRAAGDARRATLMRSLSRTVVDLSRRALADRAQRADAGEVALRWAGLHYGADIEARVRAYLAARRSVP